MELQVTDFVFHTTKTLRPKKINVEFPLTLPKKLGSVGQ